MPVPTGFERAYLQVEGGAQIKCWFNPKDYQISQGQHLADQAADGTRRSASRSSPAASRVS